MLVASANPEDYTNRGRIITPLKDRFGAQIRTHYPLDLETEIGVIDQEASVVRPDGMRVEVPRFMEEIVATISQLARQSPHINQRSGVSVRLSVANYETMVASAVRRALRLGEPEAVPRITDLESLPASTSGKVEIETIDEGRDGHVIERLVQQAVLTVFKATVPGDKLRAASADFDAGEVVHAGDDVPATALVSAMEQFPGLREVVTALPDVGGRESPASLASAGEFVLEGLHLSKRLNKDAAGVRSTYRAR
jgi:magnesium chelatase subunit I